MQDKNLVVYYSHSGNTKKIAEIIHNKVGGDIIEIEAKEAYSKDYNTVVEQAKKEITSGYMPELKIDIEDIISYNNIFIGSPNWWNTVASPIRTFLSQHDFSDKAVIPFCTHGGGGKGKVFSDIAKECSNSTVKKGFEIYCDGGNKAEKMIIDWLKEIGL